MTVEELKRVLLEKIRTATPEQKAAIRAELERRWAKGPKKNWKN